MAESEDSFMVDSPQELLKDVTPGYCDVQSFVPVEGGYAGHCTCGAWDVVMPTHEEAHAAAVQHTMEITRKELAKRLAQEQAEWRIRGMGGRSHSLWPTISVKEPPQSESHRV